MAFLSDKLSLFQEQKDSFVAENTFMLLKLHVFSRQSESLFFIVVEKMANEQCNKKPAIPIEKSVNTKIPIFTSRYILFHEKILLRKASIRTKWRFH